MADAAAREAILTSSMANAAVEVHPTAQCFRLPLPL